MRTPLTLIMARSRKVHATAVIFSMLLCVAAFGVLSVLVVVTLVAILQILHDDLYRKHFLPHVTDADQEPWREVLCAKSRQANSNNIPIA